MHRIDVEPGVVFEKPPERLQNAALEVVVVRLAEQSLEAGNPHRHRDRFFGVTPQIRR